MELRHDTIVRGTLTEADDDMNLIMEGASYEPLQVGAPAPGPRAGLPPRAAANAGLQKGNESRLWAQILPFHKDYMLTGLAWRDLNGCDPALIKK